MNEDPPTAKTESKKLQKKEKSIGNILGGSVTSLKQASQEKTIEKKQPPPTTFSLEASRFFDERFDHQTYIQITLHSNKEEGVRTFYSTLLQAKDLAATDLKQNVYKNYKEFVNISKGIKKVESDMLSLRGLLSDLKGLHDQGISGIEASAPMAASHFVNDMHPLHELFKTVENVSKFIGPLESSSRRNLLHSGPLTELDGSSGSPQNNVLLYLFSDILLLAVKKRKGLKIKYVAEKTFGFIHLSAVDVRDARLSPDGTVFKVVDSGIRPFFFKADSVQAKRIWLQMIKHQLETLHINRANATNLESNVAATLHKDVRARTEVAPDVQSQMAEQLEELDLMISIQEYDLAFELVSQLSSHPDIHSRVGKLSQSLLRTLVHRPSNILTLRRLIFLNQLDAARSTYLQCRTQLLKEAIRKIRFQGDIPIYLHDLAHLTCASIKIACEQFHQAFHNFPQVYSFLTDWCTEQVNMLATTLVKQAGDDPSLQVLTDCLSVMESKIADLKSIGFDLQFIFWNRINPHLNHAIEGLEQKCAETLLKSILDDSFEPVENPIREGLSNSVLLFCECIESFLGQTKFLHQHPVCHFKLEASLRSLSEGFYNWQLQTLRERNLTEEQTAVIQFGIRFLATEHQMTIPWQSLTPFELSSLNQTHLDEMVDSLVPSKRIRTYLRSNPANLEPLLHQAFHETLPVPIAVGSLTQLVLDLHYLLKKAPDLSPNAASLAQGLCERVFKLYLQNGGAPASLKDGKWYEQRAMEIEKES